MEVTRLDGKRVYISQNKAGQKMRIAVAGVFHETNSFAPNKTDLNAFKWEWVQGKEEFFSRYEGTRTSMGGVLDAAEALNVELCPGLYTAATPSGMVTKEAIGEITQSVVDSISPECSGLVLILHGAMVTEPYLDVEGELLRRIRERLGSKFPIAITLDLHANISQQMVDLSDIIVGYDTYPHTDMYERAVEATELLVKLVSNKIRPKTGFRKPGMLVVPQTMLTTDNGPMKELIDMALLIEKDPQVLNVTVAGGFPFSDVPDAGMAFIVTTDHDQKLADRYATQLSEYAWEHRRRFQFPEFTPEKAMEIACEHEEGPVILVEGSDNVGGGSPADATHMLQYLVKSPRKCLAVIRDVDAVLLAHKLGVGSKLECDVGGKSDRWHGDPVPIVGNIKLLFDGVYRYVGPYMTGNLVNMGRTAVIETNQVTLILTEERTPPFDIGHIQTVGLDPRQFHVILVKAAVAWRAAFGDIAKQVIYVDTPGCCSANLHHFTYTHLQRPVYPLDKK